MTNQGAATPEAKIRIGFIGTGNMGKGMAGNLIKAGYELTVHDKKKEAADELVQQGAHWADTPKAVAQASQVVITSLPGPREIEEVALGTNGVLEGAHPGDCYIEMSTSIPSSIHQIAKAAAPKGIQVLDAPVSGGARGARKGTLAIMVGGNRAAYDFCEPIFKKLGQNIFYMGNLGSGYVTKFVNNMMGAANSQAAMEALLMGAKSGIDLQKLVDVVGSGTGASFMLANLFPYVVFKRKFEPANFSLALALKDARLALEYAKEIGVPFTFVKTVADNLAEGAKQGLADKDSSAYVTILEKQAGVELKT